MVLIEVFTWQAAAPKIMDVHVEELTCLQRLPSHLHELIYEKLSELALFIQIIG